MFRVSQVVFCVFGIAVGGLLPQMLRADQGVLRSDLADIYEKVATSIVLVTDGLEEDKGFGSGVVVHQDGYIVTAAHVVEEANQIGIRYQNGDQAEAELVTLSQHQDLALLKVKQLPKDVRVAKLGDSDRVRVGEQVFCIGAPHGMRFSLTSGIVSAIRKHVGDRYVLHSPDDLIQTDAAVNPGNSGGAMFNMRGEVVGIAVKIVTNGSSRNSAGIGLSVPSNLVKESLFENALPFVGLRLKRIPPKLARVMNWYPYECLLVEGVHKGSFAEKAGIQSGQYVARIGRLELTLGGDVIYEIGGFPVKEIEKINKYMHELKSGDSVEYVILRAGKIQKVQVKIDSITPIPQLEDFPKESKPPETAPKPLVLTEK